MIYIPTEHCTTLLVSTLCKTVVRDDQPAAMAGLPRLELVSSVSRQLPPPPPVPVSKTSQQVWGRRGRQSSPQRVD